MRLLIIFPAFNIAERVSFNVKTSEHKKKRYNAYAMDIPAILRL